MRSKIPVLLLVASSCCLADDFTVKVDEGSFALTGVLLKGGRFTISKGKATNNTDRAWRTVQFELILYDASGNVIPVTAKDSDFNELYIVTVDGFKPGDTKELKMSFRLAEALRNVREVANFKIQFKTGVYPAKYTFTMKKPSQSDALHFYDDSLDALFNITQAQITFVLRNKTDNPIKISWDQVSYVDFYGTSHRVMHKGVKLVDREQPQAPTIIPPKAQVDDLVVPTDYMAFISGNWKQENILPDNVVAKQLKGKTVSVFMPLEINGSVKNYSFEFLVSNVQ
ncbi:MAG: hypothetical protein ABSC23_13800 [Bryobacteraceae bacterium]|jgi:hypothetical protein